MNYTTINIKQKLENLSIELDSISLGDFDAIGEYTAKKRREPNSELWRSKGAFFKPNLERGILIHELITKYKLSSYFEVGFGRGYSALSAAKAFTDLNNEGQVMVVEPFLDDEHMNMLSKLFPEQWLHRLQIAKGTSKDVLPKIQGSYDLVYVDGDHTKEAVKYDFENLKDKFNYFMLFDDYRVNDPQTSIEVAEAFEEFELDPEWNVELIKMDRRLFVDDRGVKDNELTYGQILITNTKNLEAKLKEQEAKFEW